MPVKLEFISLVVPIEKIEEHYPEGFTKFKQDNHKLIGGKILYDNYLMKDGAMNPMDIEALAKEWESYGLIGIVEENGKRKWKDFCVIDYFGGLSLPCDWIVGKKGHSAAHKDDTSELIVHRENILELIANKVI